MPQEIKSMTYFYRHEAESALKQGKENQARVLVGADYYFVFCLDGFGSI